MAPTGKRRGGRDNKTRSAGFTITVPKSVSNLVETGVPESVAKMFPLSRGDHRPVNDAEKLMIEWDDFMACHLQDIVLENLFDVVVKAIRQIVACGYSEKDAELAVLKSGLYYGIMSPVMNIVNGALIFLEMKEDFGTSKYCIFEKLGNLVEYLMLEMVCVIKEVRPSLTVGEALSGLMMCDMDLAGAFEVDGGTLRSYCTVGHELGESLFSTIMNACPFKEKQTPTSSDQREPGRDLPQGYSPDKCYPNFGEMFFIKEQRVVASKRDMLRQKPSHLEKHDRSYLSKSTIETKISPWGSLVLEKRLKDLNSVNSNTKRTCSKSSVAGDNLPAAPIGSRHEKSSVKSVPPGEKNEIIQSLASRLLMLKKEHQHLADWVNENVMQAAQRLRKDQAELKALRQEKEAMGKTEKGKKYIREEDAIKRMSEIEYDIAGSASHMKEASSTTSKLEEVNFALMKELKAVKLQALESAEILQEALMREQEALERDQSWERKISLLQEELSADKRKVAELQIALEKAKGQYIQIQALCKHEEKEKEKLLAKARSIARERKHRESLAEKEEHAIRQNAETELQIKLIESKLSELNSKFDPSKTSQRKRVKGRSDSHPSEDVCPKVGGGATRMEWECVMCMTEEKSVVFLPCAHQSLCGCCNRLHEEQGLKDCPSCRTPIKRRITVRFANP